MDAPGPRRSPPVSYVAAIAAVIVASNILVQVPFPALGLNLDRLLTLGALSYPFSFLVVDLANRRYGKRAALSVVRTGTLVALSASLVCASLPSLYDIYTGGSGTVVGAFGVALRISTASGMAFFASQLSDTAIFHHLRNARKWWAAPLASTLIGSSLDTALFFSAAFMGTGVPWVAWAVVDYAIKIAFAFALLAPYRMMTRALPHASPAEA